MIFKRFSFYLAIAGIVGGVYIVKSQQKNEPMPVPFVQPARSTFTNSVAATGIIEAVRENVKIGAIKAGLVRAVNVEVGSRVKRGDALLQLDDRQAGSRIELEKAQLKVLLALVASEEVMLADVTDQFDRVAKLERDKVASEEERKRKEFLVSGSKARLAKLKADTDALTKQIEFFEVEKEVLTVRAPRDGTILQVNIRAGEYANLTAQEPLMILGDVDRLQVRADVDEQNAPQVAPNQPAVAFMKGDTTRRIPLRFVRIEPFVVPKRSLTGDNAERVDTRVLQIIFELDRPERPLYVGQQVDVFIQREGEPTVSPTTAATK